MRLPWTKPKPMRCYWLCLHFASPEDSAKFYFDNESAIRAATNGVRQLRGGEKLPECFP